MSSIAGYCDQPGTPIYCATKHGIRGVMTSLRRTAHKNNVRVNLLAPWSDNPDLNRMITKPFI